MLFSDTDDSKNMLNRSLKCSWEYFTVVKQTSKSII